MDEVSLNDNIKYINPSYRVCDGIVTRILRPDIIFVKDNKTDYEEKITINNFILNLTTFESCILQKLEKKHNFILHFYC